MNCYFIIFIICLIIPHFSVTLLCSLSFVVGQAMWLHETPREGWREGGSEEGKAKERGKNRRRKSEREANDATRSEREEMMRQEVRGWEEKRRERRGWERESREESVWDRSQQWVEKLLLPISKYGYYHTYDMYRNFHNMSLYALALTSSTLMFSFALVSYNSMPSWSANFWASSVWTTFFSGQSFLFPTEVQERCGCVWGAGSIWTLDIGEEWCVCV